MSETPRFRLNNQSAAIRELQTYPHWIGYRKEERNGRITKVPYSPGNGRHALSNDAATWSDYQTAETAAQTYHFDGLGYMFHQDFTGVDLDHCINTAGEIEPWATKIISYLNSYTEFSPSSTGVHILVRGHIPKGIRRFIPPRLQPLHKQAAIEMYCAKRYFTVTGNHVSGTPDVLNSNQDKLDKLFRRVTTNDEPTIKKKTEVVTTNKKRVLVRTTAQPPATSISPPDNTNILAQQTLSDEALLQRACEASNGARFRTLYYQGNSDNYPSPSEADMALCLHLAFWTACDANRIDRLFRQSALYREKWDSIRNDTTYGGETIQRAIQRCPEVYKPQQNKVEVLKRIETLLETANDYDLIEGESRLELQDMNEAQRWVSHPRKVSLHEVLACLHENELGDAQLFCEAFHNQACYDFIEKDWYLWRKHTWHHDQAMKIILLVDALSSIYSKAADKLNERQNTLLAQMDQIKHENNLTHIDSLKDNVQELTTQIEQLRKRAIALHSYKRMRNIITLVEPLMTVNPSIWDKQPFLLPTPEGVINLEDGSCSEGQPGDYMRISCPTIWTGLDTPCPRWESFLQEIFADKPERDEIIGFLQRLLGYGITGSTKDHIFSMFYGADGRNGKDTLLGVFHDVMGNLANVVPNDIFLADDHQRSSGSATPHLGILHGMRSAWGCEPNMGDRIDIGQVKQLTGGGDITTRPLYAKSFYTFTPTHKLFMMTNHKLTINANEEAAWERVCLIDFGMRFLDNPNPSKPNEQPRDRNLIQTLKEERSGILAWLVRGCLDWQQHGLTIPLVIKKATQDYQEEEDMLRLFIDDRCQRDPNARVSSTTLYRAYRQWHIDNQQGYPMTRTMFGREMAKRFEKGHYKTGNYYLNIELYNQSSQIQEEGEEGEEFKAPKTSSVKKKKEINKQDKVEKALNSSPSSPEPLKDATPTRHNDDTIPTNVNDNYKFAQTFDGSDIPQTCDDFDVPQTSNSSDAPPTLSPWQISQISKESEAQMPIDLIPAFYFTGSLNIDKKETYALENLPKLKKHIQCDNCREQWDNNIKHSSLAHAHQGVWWCDNCTPRYELMQLAHSRGYPAIDLNYVTVDAGCAPWLVYARLEHLRRVWYLFNSLTGAIDPALPIRENHS